MKSDRSTPSQNHADHTNKKKSDAQAFTWLKRKFFGVVQPPKADVLADGGEVTALKEKLVRLTADLHNMQTRMAKERVQAAQDAQITLLQGVLDVVDDYQRALREYEKQERDERLNVWFEGFALTIKRLQQFLSAKGVREIDCSSTFDPRFHEAVAYVGGSNRPSGTIVEVFQQGYTLGDRVVRPARVAVAQ